MTTLRWNPRIWWKLAVAPALWLLHGVAPAAEPRPWLGGPQPPPPVITIDVGRQLFVDDYLIESTSLERRFHQPEPHPANPVLRPDQPWEGSRAMPFSDGVWYDPAAGVFKMWYFAGNDLTCYATSPDGITWEKPRLDVKPGTNVVLQARRDSSTVVLDHAEKDPARRYKLFRSHSHSHPLGFSQGAWGLSLHYSADGIHWTDTVRRTGPAGDRTTVFYNPFRSAWVYSLRNPDWQMPRQRFYWEARNLETEPTWDVAKAPPIPWTNADPLDPVFPGTTGTAHLYNLDGFAYESVLVGLFTILRGDYDNRSPVGPGRPKPNSVCVGFSRDGFHWERPDRRPFINYAEDPGAWNWGNVQSAGGGCLVVGDKLYFYFSGRAGGPVDVRSNAASTGLAILRRDGFASMRAGEAGGELTTRPVRFSGDRLFVNLAAPAGELRVAVLDEQGHAYPEFTHARCRPLRGDSTLQPVTWEGGDSLASLRGKPVRLRFRLREAELFSFWVSPDAGGASHGHVAAGGPGFTGPTDTRGQPALAAGRELSR